MTIWGLPEESMIAMIFNNYSMQLTMLYCQQLKGFRKNIWLKMKNNNNNKVVIITGPEEK